MYRGIILLVLLLISACTSVDVRPLDSSLAINHVCIEENPSVAVSDFKGAFSENIFENKSGRPRGSASIDQGIVKLSLSGRKIWIVVLC